MSTKNKLESQKQQQWQPNMCGPTLIVFDKECWLCYDVALESQGGKNDSNTHFVNNARNSRNSECGLELQIAQKTNYP